MLILRLKRGGKSTLWIMGGASFERGSQVTDTMTDSDMHHTVLLVLVSVPRCVCCDLCLSVLYISASSGRTRKNEPQVWTVHPSMDYTLADSLKNALVSNQCPVFPLWTFFRPASVWTVNVFEQSSYFPRWENRISREEDFQYFQPKKNRLLVWKDKKSLVSAETDALLDKKA